MRFPCISPQSQPGRAVFFPELQQRMRAHSTQSAEAPQEWWFGNLPGVLSRGNSPLGTPSECSPPRSCVVQASALLTDFLPHSLGKTATLFVFFKVSREVSWQGTHLWGPVRRLSLSLVYFHSSRLPVSQDDGGKRGGYQSHADPDPVPEHQIQPEWGGSQGQMCLRRSQVGDIPAHGHQPPSPAPVSCALPMTLPLRVK
ncbi:hypothetical protein HJG60_011861 [Phyllostomus discolor]|uniref:Uncharacterized protein n=1 Tax=Phyllostomus discolor TaxID=89673 RepID=A0A833ZKV3_9CHIR|nr:hypothetical protein HJG60_011861 [Phyllostomus discolor]